MSSFKLSCWSFMVRWFLAQSYPYKAEYQWSRASAGVTRVVIYAHDFPPQENVKN